MQICAARRRQKINVKMLGLKQESRIQYQNTCTKQRAIRTDFPFGVSHHALRAFNNARSNPIGRTFPAHDQLSPMTGVTLRTPSTFAKKIIRLFTHPVKCKLMFNAKNGLLFTADLASAWGSIPADCYSYPVYSPFHPLSHSLGRSCLASSSLCASLLVVLLQGRRQGDLPVSMASSLAHFAIKPARSDCDFRWKSALLRCLMTTSMCVEIRRSHQRVKILYTHMSIQIKAYLYEHLHTHLAKKLKI